MKLLSFDIELSDVFELEKHEDMDYCLGDCQMTNLIICAIQETNQVKWVTGKGNISSKPLPRLKPVEEVIQDPGPDQSWMDKPIPKTKFYEWIEFG